MITIPFNIPGGLYKLPLELQAYIKEGEALNYFLKQENPKIEAERFISQISLLERLLVYLHPASDTASTYRAARKIIIKKV